MKKSIVLFIILSVILMTGCSKKVQMTSFIPTQAPEEVTDITTPEDTSGEDAAKVTEATPTPKEIHIGQTTPMYVKLDEYGAFLNIRSKPSTEGEQVGFLVHAEKIDVAEIVDGWASFLYSNAICYVNADFLVEDRPEYLEPPTATPAPTPTAAPATEDTGVKPEI